MLNGGRQPVMDTLSTNALRASFVRIDFEKYL